LFPRTYISPYPSRPYCRTQRTARHSLPTRRSSDLPQEVHEQPHQRKVQDQQDHVAHVHRGDEAPEEIRIALDQERPESLLGLHRDRKSTRLNSSHEWISYAV